jgi:hypothetical protein
MEDDVDIDSKPASKRQAGEGLATSRAASPNGTPKANASSKQALGVRRQSKQDRVIMMLRRKQGTTVSAVMKATGWQKHSVHGFFAGVVRKKLGLPLRSETSAGERIYRIPASKGGKGVKAARKSSGRKRAR